MSIARLTALSLGPGFKPKSILTSYFRLTKTPFRSYNKSSKPESELEDVEGKKLAKHFTDTLTDVPNTPPFPEDQLHRVRFALTPVGTSMIISLLCTLVTVYQYWTNYGKSYSQSDFEEIQDLSLMEDDKEELYRKVEHLCETISQFPGCYQDLRHSKAWFIIPELLINDDPYIRLTVMKALATLATSPGEAQWNLSSVVDLQQVLPHFLINKQAMDDMAHNEFRSRQLRRLYKLPLDASWRSQVKDEAEALLPWALDDFLSIYSKEVSFYPTLKENNYITHIVSILDSPDVTTRELAIKIAAGLVNGVDARKDMAATSIFPKLMNRIYDPTHNDVLLQKTSITDAKFVLERLLISESAQAILVSNHKDVLMATFKGPTMNLVTEFDYKYEIQRNDFWKHTNPFWIAVAIGILYTPIRYLGLHLVPKRILVNIPKKTIPNLIFFWADVSLGSVTMLMALSGTGFVCQRVLPRNSDKWYYVPVNFMALLAAWYTFRFSTSLLPGGLFPSVTSFIFSDDIMSAIDSRLNPERYVALANEAKLEEAAINLAKEEQKKAAIATQSL